MSALALRNPNRNIAFKFLVLVIVTSMISGILLTPVFANVGAVIQWLLRLIAKHGAKAATAAAAAATLASELSKLNKDIPKLKAQVSGREENTLYWSTAYTNAVNETNRLQNLLADDLDKISTLSGEISNLDRVIKSNQSTIDWVDGWFADNDPAFKPSEARKLNEDRTAATNARDNAIATKADKQALQYSLQNRLPGTRTRIGEAERLENYRKARWDSAAASEKALKETIENKEKRAKALPGLIQEQNEAAAKAEDEKKAAEQRLRDHNNQNNGNNDD